MAELLILSIETSTGCGSVSLTYGTMDEGRLLAEFTHRPDVTHSRRLLGSIQQIMSMAEVSWDSLDGVAVSLGPGSFTGLRIGMAAAKGIAFAAGVPIYGIPSPHALAAQCTGGGKQVCCVLDARKGQVYAAMYKPGEYQPSGAMGEGTVHPETGIAVLTPDELLEAITEPTLLVGPGIAPYHDVFAAHRLLEIVPQAQVQPRAAMIGFLAARKIMEGEDVPELPHCPQPLYVRASEAEINLQKKQKRSAS